MTLQRRIATLIAACLFFIVTLAVVAGMALQVTANHMQRVETGHTRFEVLADLIRLTSHYTEQVAEVLLIGRAELRDLASDRIAIERALTRLHEVSEEKYLGSEAGAQHPEIHRSRQIAASFHSIDASVANVVSIVRTDTRRAVIDSFRFDVSDRVRGELSPLLIASLEVERFDLGNEIKAANALQSNLVLTAIGLVALALVALVILGIALFRSPGRPATAGSEARVVAAPAEARTEKRAAELASGV